MDGALTGRTLGGGAYRVGRLLGQGAMGAVYEGVQEALGRAVAIKVLHASKGQLRQDQFERFQREAKAAAALGHANIVQITDFQWMAGEPPFLVMERLVGQSLGEAIKRNGKLPAQRVAFISAQVLAALHQAHTAGIVHRDIKPDNVFLTLLAMVNDIVKVLDFGVAKLLDEAPLTMVGAMIGSPAYMPPEQAFGRPVDARSDVYAVGATMYHALSGRPPLDARDAAEFLTKVELPVPPLAELVPGFDRALSEVVAKAMAKRPEERFPSADAMRLALMPWAKPRSPSMAELQAQVPVRSNTGSFSATRASAPPPAGPAFSQGSVAPPAGPGFMQGSVAPPAGPGFMQGSVAPPAGPGFMQGSVAPPAGPGFMQGSVAPPAGPGFMQGSVAPPAGPGFMQGSVAPPAGPGFMQGSVAPPAGAAFSQGSVASPAGPGFSQNSQASGGYPAAPPLSAPAPLVPMQGVVTGGQGSGSRSTMVIALLAGGIVLAGGVVALVFLKRPPAPPEQVVTTSTTVTATSSSELPPPDAPSAPSAPRAPTARAKGAPPPVPTVPQAPSAAPSASVAPVRNLNAPARFLQCRATGDYAPVLAHPNRVLANRTPLFRACGDLAVSCGQGTPKFSLTYTVVAGAPGAHRVSGENACFADSCFRREIAGSPFLADPKNFTVLCDFDR